MKYSNITHRVEFEQPKNDRLAITKCACGGSFVPGQFVITTHKENPVSCPKCGCRLFWNGNIRVYKVFG